MVCETTPIILYSDVLEDLDFILEDSDFILEDLDFILEDLDFILEDSDFILEDSDFILEDSDFILEDLDFIAIFSKIYVNFKPYLISLLFWQRCRSSKLFPRQK